MSFKDEAVREFKQHLKQINFYLMINHHKPLTILKFRYLLEMTVAILIGLVISGFDNSILCFVYGLFCGFVIVCLIYKWHKNNSSVVKMINHKLAKKQK